MFTLINVATTCSYLMFMQLIFWDINASCTYTVFNISGFFSYTVVGHGIGGVSSMLYQT